MTEKLRGQLRHILGTVGTVITMMYVPESQSEVFTLQWEILVGLVMMTLPLIDSWVRKDN